MCSCVSRLTLVTATLLLALPAAKAESPRQPFYNSTPSRLGASGGFVQNVAFTTRDESTRAEESKADRAREQTAAGPVIPGERAIIRRGIAYAPSAAPENVKRAIWAINRIVGRRYKWGGGHWSFVDDGYDCSGTVSYALHHAGLLEAPLGSGELARFGASGRGRWITVYARSGHVFAVIAGLRLDTTDFRAGGNVGPRWQADGRDTFGYQARHFTGA